MCLADVGRVLSVDGASGTAEVELGDTRRVVSLAPLVLDDRGVEPGNWVVVHTGLAVELMEESAAAEVMAARSEMFVSQPGDEEGSTTDDH